MKSHSAWWAPAGFCLLLSAFSIVVHPGYEVAARDQTFYLTGIVQAMHPGSLSRDLYMTFNPGRYTVFGSLVLALVRHAGLSLYSALLALALVSRWLLFGSILAATRKITRDEAYSYVACLLMLSSFLLYGTGILTFDTELLPRSLALSLAAFVIAAALYGQLALGLFGVLATLAIHPITGLPVLCYYYVALYRSRSPAKAVYALLPPALMLLRAAHSPVHEDLHLLARFDPDWLSLLRARSPSTWAANWMPGAYFHLIASILLLALAWPEARDRCRSEWATLMLLVAIGVGGFLATLIGLDALRFTLFAWLQPARYLIFLKIISRLAFGWTAYRALRDNDGPAFYRFALLWIMLCFAAEERFIWLGLPVVFAYRYIRRPWLPWLAWGLFVSAAGTTLFKFRHQPDRLWTLAAFLTVTPAYFAFGLRRLRISHAALAAALAVAVCSGSFSARPDFVSNRDLMALCHFLDRQTPPDALLATDPYSALPIPIRILSLRSIYVSEKEGSEGIYSRAFMFEWRRRMNLAASHPGAVQWRQEGVDYVIGRGPLTGFGAPVFENSTYSVYRIPQ